MTDEQRKGLRWVIHSREAVGALASKIASLAARFDDAILRRSAATGRTYETIRVEAVAKAESLPVSVLQVLEDDRFWVEIPNG